MVKSYLKNYTPFKEMRLYDIILYFVNHQDTKKIKITNSNNIKNTNNCLIKKYISERYDLIQYLSRLVKQFNYTDRTYYYTISIFDTIFSLIESNIIKPQMDIKIDLFLICSLLLSGIKFFSLYIFYIFLIKQIIFF